MKKLSFLKRSFCFSFFRLSFHNKTIVLKKIKTIHPYPQPPASFLKIPIPLPPPNQNKNQHKMAVLGHRTSPLPLPPLPLTFFLRFKSLNNAGSVPLDSEF